MHGQARFNSPEGIIPKGIGDPKERQDSISNEFVDGPAPQDDLPNQDPKDAIQPFFHRLGVQALGKLSETDDVSMEDGNLTPLFQCPRQGGCIGGAEGGATMPTKPRGRESLRIAGGAGSVELRFRGGIEHCSLTPRALGGPIGDLS